ncbi:MAG: hypothetical protein Q9187_006263, partial [Circinaria calcarea]
MRKILDSRSRYTRSIGFDSFRVDPHVGNVISERDPTKHNQRRRQLAAGYGGRDVDYVESSVDNRVNEVMRTIDERWISTPDNTKRLDISMMIQYLSMDVITHLLFGKPFGYVHTYTDVHGFIQIIKERLPIVEQFFVLTELCDLLLFVSYVPGLRSILPSPRDNWGIGKVMGIARQAVGERFMPNYPPRKDILGSFLRHGLSKEQAESEITVSLFAGSDTTATSTRITLVNIITNPGVYAKLQKEIDDAVAAGAISRPIQVAEAAKLPYLQACIKEGLRILPPIGSLRERVTPPEGDIINGHSIPGGVNVGFNILGMQRSEVFGADPDVFRPERWLHRDTDRLQKMQMVLDLIFGHGETKCLGVKIAYLTLNKFFVE